MVLELGEMLDRENITKNLILVGYGFASFNMRVYANRHPERILGVVKKL